MYCIQVSCHCVWHVKLSCCYVHGVNKPCPCVMPVEVSLFSSVMLLCTASENGKHDTHIPVKHPINMYPLTGFSGPGTDYKNNSRKNRTGYKESTPKALKDHMQDTRSSCILHDFYFLALYRPVTKQQQAEQRTGTRF